MNAGQNITVALLLALAAGSAVCNAQGISRASLANTGVPANAPAGSGHMTPDGRFVVFTSSAANLVTSDTNGTGDVFVRDRLLNTTVRVSVPDAATTGNAQSFGLASLAAATARVISDDGRFVVFASTGDDLVLNDTNDVADIFVRDRDLDEDGIFDEPVAGATRTRRVNLSNSETQINQACPQQTCSHQSYSGTISADGRFVAFVTAGSPTGDNAPYANVYVRDRDADNDGLFDETGGVPDAATLELASPKVCCEGQQFDGFCEQPTISANGRFVSFTSHSAYQVFNDTNTASDVFVRDMIANTTVRVSLTSAGGQGEINADSSAAAISATGRFVAFASNNDALVAGDDGQRDIFVRDRDSDADGIFDEAGAVLTEKINFGYNPTIIGGQVVLNGASDAPSISADGRRVAFHSDATNYYCSIFDGCTDQNGKRDLFLRDRQTNSTTRLSVTGTGVETAADSNLPAISPDGRFVVFSSQGGLAGADGNSGGSDVFVRAVVGEPNSTCGAAFTAVQGFYEGDTFGAGITGVSTCNGAANAADVYYKYTAPCTGSVRLTTEGSSFDTVLAVHSACNATVANTLVCNDDANGGASRWSDVTLHAQAGTTYTIRLSGWNTAEGFYRLNIGGCVPATCGSIDFDGDGDEGTDADIEAFFARIAGGVCPTGTCGSIDFDGDGDEGTDADIEAFFRVIAGGPC